MPLDAPSPITWQGAQFPQASDFNAQIRDAFNFLKAKTVFRAWQAVVQSIPNNSVTVLTLDTVLEDTYTGWTSGASNKYTAQVDGLYLVTMGYASTGGNAVGNVCAAFVSATAGANTQYEGQQTPIPSQANWLTLASMMVALRAGNDFVQPLAFQTSGAALSTVSPGIAIASFMEVEWISS